MSQHSSYPPSRPATVTRRRPARSRTATAGNQAAAAGSQEVQPSTSQGEVAKQPMPTSTVIAWWRILVVLACLVVGVVAPLVLNGDRASLIQVNDAAQQVLRLQSVRGDVLAADAAASNALVVAGENGTPDDSHRALLASASAALVEASASRPADQEALMQINSALTSYVGALVEGMVTRDAALMGIASDRLHSELVPALDEQIALNEERLALSTADQRWLSFLVFLPIAVLLAASVILARRTRRLLNIGLVVALGLSVTVLVLTTQLVTTSASSVSSVRAGSLVQATSAARAYALVTEAKAWEGRVLLGSTTASAGESAFNAALDEAVELVADLSGAEEVGMPAQLDALGAAHADLIAAVGDPAAQTTAREASDTAYQALVAWLPEQAATSGERLDSQLLDHAATVGQATTLTAVAMVAAALAAGIGMSQPLRRYR